MSLEDTDRTAAGWPEQSGSARDHQYRRNSSQTTQKLSGMSHQLDLTDRAKSSYSDFIHDLPTPALLLDLGTWHVSEVNDLLLTLTGHARQEIEGKKVNRLGIAGGKDRQVSFSQFLENGFEYRNVGMQLRGSDDDLHHVLSSARMVSEAGNSYLLVIFTELTAHRSLMRLGVEVLARKRRKMGESLQEDLTQTLSGLRLLGRALADELSGDPSAAGSMADDFNVYLDKAAVLTRELREELLPVEVDEQGLSAALCRYVHEVEDQYGRPCRFACKGNVRISNHTAATTCYYIVEETVEYFVRSGHEGPIEIAMRADEGTVELAVTCQNASADEDTVQQIRSTLRLMRYTFGLLGGELEVDDRSDGGLRVTCSISE